MSAVADFYLECVENDCLPLSDETWSYLDRIDSQYQTVWIDQTEFEFTSRFGETRTIEGITVECARRLCRLGFGVTEIKDFIDLIEDCGWTRL